MQGVSEETLFRIHRVLDLRTGNIACPICHGHGYTTDPLMGRVHCDDCARTGTVPVPKAEVISK